MQGINYFGISGQPNPATVVVPRDEPRPAQLQPSLTRFSLILVKDPGGADPGHEGARGGCCGHFLRNILKCTLLHPISWLSASE